MYISLNMPDDDKQKDQNSNYPKPSVENAALTLFSSLLNRFEFDIQFRIQSLHSSNLKRNFERSMFHGQKTSHFFNSTINSKTTFDVLQIQQSKIIHRRIQKKARTLSSPQDISKENSSTTTEEGKGPLFTTQQHRATIFNPQSYTLNFIL